MDALNQALAALEQTRTDVINKINELKAAGDPAALAAVTTRINTVVTDLQGAINPTA